jgi:hypothetical protein
MIELKIALMVALIGILLLTVHFIDRARSDFRTEP